MILVHSAQHFPYSLFESFYKDLNLPFPPHYLVNCGGVKKIGMTLSKQTHRIDVKTGSKLTMLVEKGVSKVSKENPDLMSSALTIMDDLNVLLKGELKDIDLLLVHGDTLTAMCGAIAAHLNKIKVGHVEAGLRTFAKEPFPEETSRRIADACCDYHFSPTKETMKNLLNEGFKESAYLTGNTVVDAVQWAKKKGSDAFISSLGMDEGKKWIYFTSHRRENFTDEKRVRNIVKVVYELADMGYQILWSNKPGNARYFDKYGISIPKHKNIIMVEGISQYTENIHFMSKCDVIVTDSGGMQEEAASLKIPCITLRPVTERPETVTAGVNFLADPTKAINIKVLLEKANKVKNYPEIYGDGKSSSQIFDVIEKKR
jgi:UDP-N-acetylglucosamine 2-epimerase (non-hydrolysing)